MKWLSLPTFLNSFLFEVSNCWKWIWQCVLWRRCVRNKFNKVINTNTTNGNLLFLYKSPNMQRLYRRYALPLFFMVVKTKVNYQVCHRLIFPGTHITRAHFPNFTVNVFNWNVHCLKLRRQKIMEILEVGEWQWRVKFKKNNWSIHIYIYTYTYILITLSAEIVIFERCILQFSEFHKVPLFAAVSLFHDNRDAIFSHRIHDIWCFDFRLWQWNIRWYLKLT